MSQMITVLYDCRSKQEYIYRTNKIREIAGGSALLANVYNLFIEKCMENNIKIDSNWKEKKFSMHEFENSSFDGIVVYEGGGNLYVIFKYKEIYLEANKIFSKMLLKDTYSISVIASCVETTDNFNADKKKLYEMNRYQKNLGINSIPCNSLPFTQLDKNTWMPVVKKESKSGNINMLSYESQKKLEAYKKYCSVDEVNQSENLDSLVWEKGEESLLAVIYIDGNAMGAKIKNLTKEINDYNKCVDKYREFSCSTDKIYVKEPIKAIENFLGEKRKISMEREFKKKDKDKNYKIKTQLNKYRKIISGGDEITLICNARDAKDIVIEYFNSLSKHEGHASCAGVAIFHSHDPFSEIYKIAEACCEQGKEKTRFSGSKDNYIDFHYCHSGITNDLEKIRENQEKDLTLRPYKLEDFKKFCDYGNSISEIGRQNIKTLRDSYFEGESHFQFEIERIISRYPNGKFKKLCEDFRDTKEFGKLIYDVSLVYDLWFADEEELDEAN